MDVPASAPRPADVLPFVLRLSKVNAQTGEFEADAALEVPDDARELCDYASSKQHFERLEKRCLEESGGRKVAPLREMHQLIAAGNVTRFTYDDGARRVACAGKITNPESLAKAIDGTLCGVSMGGMKKYIGFDALTGARRYTAIPNEISLVDLGAIPGTALRMLNAAGGAIEVVDGDDSTTTPIPGLADALAFEDATDTLAKAMDAMRGQRQRMQKLHDIACEMGAACTHMVAAAVAEPAADPTLPADVPAPMAQAAGEPTDDSPAGQDAAEEEDEMTPEEMTKAVQYALGLEQADGPLAKAIGGALGIGAATTGGVVVLNPDGLLAKAVGAAIIATLGLTAEGASDGLLAKAIGTGIAPITEKLSSIEERLAIVEKQPAEAKGGVFSLAKAADSLNATSAQEALGEAALRKLGETNPIELAKLLQKQANAGFHLDHNGASPLS